MCSLACFPFCASQYNSPVLQITSRSTRDLHKSKSNLESLFCYDKAVPEENIEKPVGLSLDKVNIGNKPPCSICEAKGAVLCATCSGSGLYIDSILESQGIIVKVRCLGNMLHLFSFCFVWFVFKLDYPRNLAWWLTSLTFISRMFSLLSVLILINLALYFMPLKTFLRSM